MSDEKESRGWINSSVNWTIDKMLWLTPMNPVRLIKQFMPESSEGHKKTAWLDDKVHKIVHSSLDWVSDLSAPVYQPETRKIDGKDQVVAVVYGDKDPTGKPKELKVTPTGSVNLEAFGKERLSFEKKNGLKLDPESSLGKEVKAETDKQEDAKKIAESEANEKKQAEENRRNPPHPFQKIMHGDLLGAVKDFCRTHWGKVIMGVAVMILGDKAGDMLGQIAHFPGMTATIAGLGLGTGVKGLGWATGLYMIGSNAFPALKEVGSDFASPTHKGATPTLRKEIATPTKANDKTTVPAIPATAKSSIIITNAPADTGNIENEISSATTVQSSAYIRGATSPIGINSSSLSTLSNFSPLTSPISKFAKGVQESKGVTVSP